TLAGKETILQWLLPKSPCTPKDCGCELLEDEPKGASAPLDFYRVWVELMVSRRLTRWSLNPMKSHRHYRSLVPHRHARPGLLFCKSSLIHPNCAPHWAVSEHQKSQ